MGCQNRIITYILCRKFGKSTFLTDRFRIVVSELTDICRIPPEETDIYRTEKIRIRHLWVRTNVFDGHLWDAF